MDCAEIRQGFLTGGVPSGASVDEHLKWCAECAELFGKARPLGCRLADAVPRTSFDLKGQLLVCESLIASERGVRAFLRSRSTRTRWVLCLALAVAVLTVELLRKHLPIRELSTSRALLGLLLLGVLAWIAHSALQPLPLERAAARRRSLFALVAWSMPCVLCLAPETSLSADGLSSSGFALRSLDCFGYGSALAAPSFALLWAFDRGQRVPYRVWVLAAGLVALA